MLKLTKITNYDTQNNYQVSYEGVTVAEVLEEIKEYTNNSDIFGKLDDYGCQKTDPTGHGWEICIDGQPYKSLWYNHKVIKDIDLSAEVVCIECSGGWYCALDFNLITEKVTAQVQRQ